MTIINSYHQQFSRPEKFVNDKTPYERSVETLTQYAHHLGREIGVMRLRQIEANSLAKGYVRQAARWVLRELV